MHPLAKKIALLVALFSAVLGLFLLGYNLRLIPEGVKSAAINLWPVLLVAAGIVLVADSVKKRGSSRASALLARQHPLPIPPAAVELSCRVQFSYGRLVISSTGGAPCLVTENDGRVSAPAISHETIGGVSRLALSMAQPLFPSHFQLRNIWRLDLARGIPLRLTLNLHEANLHMDLRDLDVESLDLKADSGAQEILLGQPRKKISVQVYSSSAKLSLVLPPKAFTHVQLLNPFCRVDYPQGDLEKREDGSLVSTSDADTQGSVEVSIDGPIRNLVLDIDEAPQT